MESSLIKTSPGISKKSSRRDESSELNLHHSSNFDEAHKVIWWLGISKHSKDGLKQRHLKTLAEEESAPSVVIDDEKLIKQQGDQWRRVLLLVIAVTVHNIPGDECSATCYNISSETILHSNCHF